MNMTSRDQAPLTWPRRIGYSAGDFGSNLYWQSISLFLYFFYTDTLGISPVWAGVAFAVGSIYDAISDPVMGSIADRTRTKRGRYRPYVLFGAIPLALSFVAMFYVPPLSGMALVIYATLTHMLCRTFYTVVNIPYLAMSPNLTSDSGERGALAGLRMVFAAMGAVTIALFMPKLVATFGTQYAQPWLLTAVLASSLATLIFFVCYRSTRENPFANETQGEPLTLRSVAADVAGDVVRFWSMLRHNGPLAQVFGAIVVVSVALTMFSKNALYWFKYGIARPDLIPAALVIPAAMLLVCAPLWVWLSRRTSKRTTWMIGSILASVGYLGFFFNSNTATPVVLGWIVLIGAGTSSFAIMYWAMLPDTVEFNEWKLGQRNEAKIVGFAAFAQKSALAINALILGQVLDSLGYVPNQALSVETLMGIKATMCLVPLAGVIAAVAMLWRYPITPAYHRKLVVDLAERDRLRSLQKNT